jgi:hypothetical protein
MSLVTDWYIAPAFSSVHCRPTCFFGVLSVPRDQDCEDRAGSPVRTLVQPICPVDCGNPKKANSVHCDLSLIFASLLPWQISSPGFVRCRCSSNELRISGKHFISTMTCTNHKYLFCYRKVFNFILTPAQNRNRPRRGLWSFRELAGKNRRNRRRSLDDDWVRIESSEFRCRFNCLSNALLMIMIR